ncbi:MAG: flippase-like domain-containing protein, partial [Mycobacteriaceae bacterium]|nr:flippase-like domain-containing protein [Mycobacteriaceae bacterium]
IGIAVLLVFATIGLLYGPATSQPLEMKAPVFFMTFGVCIVLPFLPQICTRLLGEDNWLSKKLNHSTVRVYWQNKPTMFKALILSIVFQMLMVGTHILVGMSLGLTFNQVSFWYYFVFYPLVAVLGFVTPSVNGIGVREWAYTYFLTASNVESSTALTYALIWLGMTASGSIIGGIVYVLGHFRVPNEDAGVETREQFDHSLADQRQT